MLPKDLSKIDKYYFAFLVFLIVMGGILVVTLKVVFSSVVTGFEIDSTTEKEAKIDIDKLNEASIWATGIKSTVINQIPVASISASPTPKKK